MDKEALYKIWAELTAEPEAADLLKESFDEQIKVAICLAYAIGQKKAIEELMESK